MGVEWECRNESVCTISKEDAGTAQSPTPSADPRRAFCEAAERRPSA